MSENACKQDPLYASNYNTISGYRVHLRPSEGYTPIYHKDNVPPQFKVELSTNSGLFPLHPLYSGTSVTPIIKYELDKRIIYNTSISYTSAIYFYLTGISTTGYYYIRVQPFDPSNNNTGDYSLFKFTKDPWLFDDDYYNPIFWGKVYIKPVL